MPKPFVRHGSQLLLTTPIFRLREDRASHPVTGHTASYYVLENPDFVNVIAVTEADELVMVRQWRHGSESVELEIPAGMIEPGEPPAEAAARELVEETGYVAARWTPLGSVRPNVAYMTNTCFSFLAEGCRRVADLRLDEGEDIEVELVPRAAVRDLVRGGTLRSALVVSSLFWWLDQSGRVDWR